MEAGGGRARGSDLDWIWEGEGGSNGWSRRGVRVWVVGLRVG